MGRSTTGPLRNDLRHVRAVWANGPVQLSKLFCVLDSAMTPLWLTAVLKLWFPCWNGLIWRIKNRGTREWLPFFMPSHLYVIIVIRRISHQTAEKVVFQAVGFVLPSLIWHWPKAYVWNGKIMCCFAFSRPHPKVVLRWLPIQQMLGMDTCFGARSDPWWALPCLRCGIHWDSTVGLHNMSWPSPPT